VIAIFEAAATGLFYLAIDSMKNPAVVSFIGNIGPVFVTLLGLTLLRERFRLIQLAGIMITLAGVYVINYRQGGFAGFTDPGARFVIGASFLFALATITGLICAAILARLLTKQDYASYRQTLLAYTFVSPLLMLGLPTGLFYFLARDRKHGRSILSGNILLLFSMGIVFFIAIWSGLNELLADRFNNPALKDLLLIYSPYALLALPVITISACLVSYNRVKSLTIYNVLSKIIIFGAVVGFVLIWPVYCRISMESYIKHVAVFFALLQH